MKMTKIAMMSCSNVKNECNCAGCPTIYVHEKILNKSKLGASRADMYSND